MIGEDQITLELAEELSAVEVSVEGRAGYRAVIRLQPYGWGWMCSQGRRWRRGVCDTRREALAEVLGQQDRWRDC